MSWCTIKWQEQVSRKTQTVPFLLPLKQQDCDAHHHSYRTVSKGLQHPNALFPDSKNLQNSDILDWLLRPGSHVIL